MQVIYAVHTLPTYTYHPMARLQVNTSFNIDLQFETSPFHRRFFAWLTDYLIMTLYTYIMSLILAISFSLSSASEFGITELLLTLPVLVYHFLFEVFFNGQSPGKRIFRIQVVSMNGQQASISQYLLRWLMRFIDFGLFWGLVFLINGSVFLGMILMLASIGSFILFFSTPYNQRLGDLVAGTTVVVKKLAYQLSDTIFKEIDMTDYQVHFPAVMRLSDKDINIIDNIVRQHTKSDISNYVNTVAEKIKSVLKIESSMPDELFLETLLRDYNYLSRQ